MVSRRVIAPLSYIGSYFIVGTELGQVVTNPETLGVSTEEENKVETRTQSC